jgi:hypothetical protein
MQRLRIYTNPAFEDKKFRLYPLEGKMLSCKMVSRRELFDTLLEKGYKRELEEFTGEYYYLMEIEVQQENVPECTLLLQDVLESFDNASNSQHSPKLALLA